MIGSEPPSSPFHAPQHRHDRCIASGLAEAERRARQAGQRLTPQRRRVLEILLADHRPMGAYDILNRMGTEAATGPHRRPAPPIVYRALDFLGELGMVHRISRLNAFVACDRRGACAGDGFLICETCGQVAELHDAALRDQLAAAADRAGFRPSGIAVEMLGLCPRCRPAADNRPEGGAA